MNSWRDRDLKHSVALLAEQEIGVGDPIERKPVGEQRSEVHAPSPHQFAAAVFAVVDALVSRKGILDPAEVHRDVRVRMEMKSEVT